jgi:hypothetical protein
VVPGGWHRSVGGHVFLLVFEKAHDGTYRFTIANTGAGIQYHPSIVSYPKNKVRTAFSIVGIPKERVLSDAFLYSITKLPMTRNEENGPEASFIARENSQLSTWAVHCESFIEASSCYFHTCYHTMILLVVLKAHFALPETCRYWDARKQLTKESMRCYAEHSLR